MELQNIQSCWPISHIQVQGAQHHRDLRSGIPLRSALHGTAVGLEVHTRGLGGGCSVSRMALGSGDQVQALTHPGCVTSDSEVTSLFIIIAPTSSSVLRRIHMRPGGSGGHLGQTERVVMMTEQGPLWECPRVEGGRGNENAGEAM